MKNCLIGTRQLSSPLVILVDRGREAKEAIIRLAAQPTAQAPMRLVILRAQEGNEQLMDIMLLLNNLHRLNPRILLSHRPAVLQALRIVSKPPHLQTMLVWVQAQ